MDFTTQIRNTLTRAGRAPDDDVVVELAQHARALHERARADGADAGEARRRVDVQIALWASDAAQLARPAAKGTPAIAAPPLTESSPWAGIWNDVRYAGRLLRQQWTFSLLVIVTMAFGIGATTTLFSVAYGVLMKPLPWVEHQRIVRLEETRGGNRPRFSSFSNAAYLAWRDAPSTIESLGAWQPRILTITGAGDPGRIRVTAASASLFDVLRPKPLLGSLFDEASEGDPVVVLSDVRRPLLILLAAVAPLFVTATANVAGLQLARSTTRRREIAIRSALGAGTGRVTRQILVENLALGLCGGAAGLGVALALSAALPALLPSDFPRLQDLSLDAVVLGFAVVVSVLASLTMGLAPAWGTRRLDLVSSLAEDGAAPAGAGWRSRPARARMAIMAGQVTVATVLLVGALLLGRTFMALMAADRGFDPSGTITARLQFPGFVFAPERRADIVDAILERLRDIQGVVAGSYSDGPPLGVYGGTAFMVDARQVQASSRTVVPGYFAAMGMRFTGGRDFTDEDVQTGRQVFIVNESFARDYLGEEPVGQQVRGWVRKGPGHWEVIGVVEDVRHDGVTEPSGPEIYLYRAAHERRVSTSPTVIARTNGDPLAIVPSLRALAREQDESLAFDSVLTLEDRVMTTLARPRLYAALMAGFAGLALLIAGVGLFGVLSYSVAQRSRELAIRSAVGARPGDLLRLVLRQGLTVVAIGAGVGLALSMVTMQAIATMLYGVPARDPVTYMLVALALMTVGLLACLTPALRAARIDPLRLLKGN